MTKAKIEQVDLDKDRERLRYRRISADKLADALLAAVANGNCDLSQVDQTGHALLDFGSVQAKTKRVSCCQDESQVLFGQRK